jgi:hypothetical protein
MIGTAMKARSPKRCLMIFAGNMYPGSNSLLKKLKDNPLWVKFISGAILADGTALWQELRSVDSLLEELDNDISMGHPEIFFSEVLNDTDVGINNRVDLSKFKPWPWKEGIDKPQGSFIIIDPSANKRGGDKVAIGHFEVYDGIPGLRSVSEEALSPKNSILRALLIALQTKTRLIAVESTAYQYTFIHWFGEVSKDLGLTGIDCVEVYTGAHSKNARITDAMKQLMAGETLLHPSVKSQVVHQIANWNPIKRDNEDGILDLLAYAHRVLELYGAQLMTDFSLDYHDGDKAGVDEEHHVF